MIHVQSHLVLGLGGKIKPVGAVVFKVFDYLFHRRLAVALALFVFIDHKAPEPVSVIRFLFLWGKGEHTEADQFFIGIDRKRPRNAGGLGIGLICLSQRNVVRRDERLILANGKRKHCFAVIVVYRFKFNYHKLFFWYN